jgi:hypothetical protein
VSYLLAELTSRCYDLTVIRLSIGFKLELTQMVLV